MRDWARSAGRRLVDRSDPEHLGISTSRDQQCLPSSTITGAQSLATASTSKPFPPACQNVPSPNVDCRRVSSAESSEPPQHRLSASSRTAKLCPSRADVLSRALAQLSAVQHEIVISHLGFSDGDTDRAIHRTCSVAKRQKEICEAKGSWTTQNDGETVSLTDKADKILLLCDRLKQVQDVAIGADTSHAELPWAGICLMLDVAIADQEQMSFLLEGFQVALEMANRLEIYWEFFAALPTNTATEKFGAALTRFYTFILEFFADAIACYRKSTVPDFLHTLADMVRGTEFQLEHGEHVRRLEAKAAISEQFVDLVNPHMGRELYDNLRADLLDIEDIRDHSGSGSGLYEQCSLLGLHAVLGAAFDSYSMEDTTMCLSDTRVELLAEIMDWAKDPQGSFIYWLEGASGSGKSTIARTVADALNKRNCLGASFFFRRGETDRSSAGKLIATLAYQLAARVPRFGQEVTKSFELNPEVTTRHLREQFDNLLQGPLRATPVRRPTPTWVIVLDALDEIDTEQDIPVLINLLAELESTCSVKLRIFVTSRPELSVRRGFGSLSGGGHRKVVLEDATASTVDADISRFLDVQLANIRAGRIRSLPLNWPDDNNLRELTEMVSPSFLYAATICRFLADPNRDATNQLDIVLQQPSHMETSPL